MIYDEVFANPKPFLTTNSIKWLDEHLTSKMVGVEYGGGGSTIWFLKRLKELFTIEANPTWATHLIAQVARDQRLFDKWRLYLVNCIWQIDDLENRWYVQTPMAEEDRELMEKRFCMLNVPADFILIDGGIRYLTLEASLKILKPGGILCVDNMELPARKRYVECIIPEDWERFDFPEDEGGVPSTYFGHDKHNGEWITSIWKSK